MLILTQTCEYDPVNRLESAREVNNAAPCRDQSGAVTDCWRQQFTYLDSAEQNGQFGNRRLDPDHTTANVLPPQNPQIDPANNRFADNQGYAYDEAGNLTAEPGGRTYAYDAENRLTTVNGGVASGVGAEYAYDGDGRRVRKVTAAATTVFVYDAMGRLVAEYSNQARGGGGTSYLTQDHLGSTRVVTDQNQTVLRHDYLPFGEEIGAGIGGRTTNQGYGQPSSIRKRWAQLERDSETGLDYAQARYYSPMMGRFTSVDPENAGAYQDEPQSWNGYAYVQNNPLSFIDPEGLERLVCDDQNNCKQVGDFDGEKSKEITGGVFNDGAYWNAKKQIWETRAEFRDRMSENPLWAISLHMKRMEQPMTRLAVGVAAAPFVALGGAQVAAVAGVGGTSGSGVTALNLGTRAIPTLTGTTSRAMLRQAIGIIQRLGGTPEQKANLFEKLAAQIMQKTGGSWNSIRVAGSDGSHIFIGRAGEALVISPQGQLFRGTLQQGLQGSGTSFTPIYNALKALH